METCPLRVQFPVAACRCFVVKLPQISRYLVSTLGPEEPWWDLWRDLCWSVRSSAKGETRWGNLLPHQECCFSQGIRAVACFISPTCTSLQGPWFSLSSALGASSPPSRSMTRCGSAPCSPGDPDTLPTQNKSLRPSSGSCCPDHAPVASGCWRGAPCPPARGWQGSSTPFPDESFSLELHSSKGMICSYSLLMNF